MSECVVRMEMPQDGVCNGCDARTVEFLTGPICTIKKKFLGSRRPSWCPILYQLPEGHGRLVDADEFLKRAIGTKCFHNEDDARMLQGLVGESITIVPAERGEE